MIKYAPSGSTQNRPKRVSLLARLAQRLGRSLHILLPRGIEEAPVPLWSGSVRHLILLLGALQVGIVTEVWREPDCGSAPPLQVSRLDAVEGDGPLNSGKVSGTTP